MNVTLAFIRYIMYVSMPYKSKVMLEEAILNLCKITEPRKYKLKVENLGLHDLKEF